MTRDRLAALRAARGDLANDTTDGEVSIRLEESPSFMESFFNEVTHIQESLDHLSSQIEELKKISAAIASPLSENVDENLEALMSSIKKSATKIKTKLKDIENTMESIEGQDKSSALYRIRFTQHAALSKRFADIMHQYNNAQIEYREKCKQVIKAQLEVTGNLTTDEELEEMLETKDPEIFTQRILTDTKAAKQTLADITARHADIIKLEKSIKELHDLFMDMAVLVDSQGEMIDRIEHQVTETKNYVAKANEETAKAVIYHKKARRKKTLIYICLVIVLIVIITVVTLSLLN
ncbi:syntaxin [Tetranychus urticae]|uniref:t-SNARE coiled-coil homology domain-containing protein n=1 Tax=Tetranychus urticae TaxID=32264 RepID=T1KT88_TETUR|nr:syntaxin [Tetranychus urticae]